MSSHPSAFGLHDTASSMSRSTYCAGAARAEGGTAVSAAVVDIFRKHPMVEAVIEAAAGALKALSTDGGLVGWFGWLGQAGGSCVLAPLGSLRKDHQSALYGSRGPDSVHVACCLHRRR